MIPGITILDKENHDRHHITAVAKVPIFETLLKAEFFNFGKNENSTGRGQGRGGVSTIIRAHEYSLPESIVPVVDAVFNTVQFPVEIKRGGGGGGVGHGPHLIH